MNTQDLINESAKKFIEEMEGKQFTEKDFRNILFGNMNNYYLSLKKETIILDLYKHPNFVTHIGSNGQVLDKALKYVQNEKELWYNELLKDLSLTSD